MMTGQFLINMARITGITAACLVIAACVGVERTAQSQATLLPEISFDDFIAPGCDVKSRGENQISVMINSGAPCTLILQNELLRTLPEDAWLSYLATVDGLESPTANLLFWSADNTGPKPDLISASGLFPGLKGRNSFPLAVLAEGRGAPKTPGTLIQFSFGKSVELNKWSRVGLSLMKISGPPATIELEEFKFTPAQPDYPVPDSKLIDALGQWIQKDWKDKVSNPDDMISRLQSEAARDRVERPSKYSQFGGIKTQQFGATGFFRTHHDSRRWWLVDPEGYGFYSIGIDIVGPGISGNVDGIEKLHEWIPDKQGEFADAWETETMHDIMAPQGKQIELLNFHTTNLIRAFGPDWHDQWSRLTANRLVDWNVNSLGNWSDQEFARKEGIPYVVPLQNFPVTDKRIFRDFPDVFSTEYEQRAEQFAQQLNSLKDDKYLIGYFMNNEPGWAYVPSINLAEELLAQGEGYASKKVLVDFLATRYNGNITQLNAAWGTTFEAFASLEAPIESASKLSDAAEKDLQDFSAIMLDRYIEVPVLATKAVDPNHLNMGMRWASAALQEDWRFAGTQHLDVFSMNNYTDNPASRLELAAKMTGKPILIGEFHHGSMEAGHSAFGARWTRTEAERVDAYRYYAENAALHPFSIGIHYFSYNDDPVLGRFDGQNFHQGFVSVTHTPYSDFVEGYSKVNDQLYDVVQGIKEPDEKYPDGTVMAIPMTF